MTQKSKKSAKAGQENKEELKERMAVNTFNKKFDALSKALSSDKYSNKYFPKDAVVTLPGHVFQAVLEERRIFSNFLDEIVTSSDRLIASTHELTFALMTEYKDLVDKGIAIDVEPESKTISEDQQKIQGMQARFARRSDQLTELGYSYTDKKFVLKDSEKNLDPQQVFEASEEEFLKMLI